MRYLLRRFQGEPELFRRQLRPVLNGLRRRDAMKRVIDLSRSESVGVIRQHFGGRQIFRVKIALPFRILET